MTLYIIIALIVILAVILFFLVKKKKPAETVPTAETLKTETVPPEVVESTTIEEPIATEKPIAESAASQEQTGGPATIPPEADLGGEPITETIASGSES